MRLQTCKAATQRDGDPDRGEFSRSRRAACWQSNLSRSNSGTISGASRVEIPFYRGGIIDGIVSVDTRTGMQGQGGLRLLIKGVSVQYEQTIRTFADGGFYAMDIPPGQYTLEIDQAQMGFLNVTWPQGLLKFEIKASAQGDYVEGQKIVLIHEPQKPEGK